MKNYIVSLVIALSLIVTGSAVAQSSAQAAKCAEYADFTEVFSEQRDNGEFAMDIKLYFMEWNIDTGENYADHYMFAIIDYVFIKPWKSPIEEAQAVFEMCLRDIQELKL